MRGFFFILSGVFPAPNLQSAAKVTKPEQRTTRRAKVGGRKEKKKETRSKTQTQKLGKGRKEKKKETRSKTQTQKLGKEKNRMVWSRRTDVFAKEPHFGEGRHCREAKPHETQHDRL
eukprot:1187485-Rhodomonas_salina.2